MLDTKDPTIKYFPCPFKCNSNTQPKSEEELDLHILRRHYTSKLKKSGKDFAFVSFMHLGNRSNKVGTPPL